MLCFPHRLARKGQIMNARWKQRPEGSTWGDFGADDQLGRLNLLTPEKVKQGAAEVKEGIAFCLSIPLDYPGGNVVNVRRHPPALSPTYREGKPFMNFPTELFEPTSTTIISDDQVTMCLQYSTQWDSFAHVGSFFDANSDGVPEKVYYNGYQANTHVRGPLDYQGKYEHKCEPPYGALALGVENMAVKGIQTRGVVVDLHAHYGDKKEPVGYDALMRIFEQDNVIVERGDILLLHTGWTALMLQMNKQPNMDVLNNSSAGLDGADDKLLQWITDSGVAALCADNYAVEFWPPRRKEGRGPMLPLHHHCLFKLGVPLGEIWWMRELALWMRANKRNRCLLTAPPLRLPGAVGSPATPIATV
jgi:kynurenine formamidase